MIRIKQPWKAENVQNCWEEFSACEELIMRLSFAMHAPIMGHEKATHGLAPASANSHCCVTYERVAAAEKAWICQVSALSRIHK